MWKKLLICGLLPMTHLFAATNTSADNTELNGYSEGAKVIQIGISQHKIDSINSLVYSQPKGAFKKTELHMSLLLPQTEAPKPAVIFYPGGGFLSADNGRFAQMRMALAEAGFVVASAEYRVVPNQFPCLVEDAKSAVRYLRAHAKEFGIDTTRIGVLGDSAGGYVVQMLGTTNGETAFDKGDNLDQSSDVQAVATLYGISNLLNIGEGYSDEIVKVHASPSVTEALLVNGAAFMNFPGASVLDTPEKALKASPLGHIDGNEPPFLIMHGNVDGLVSPVQSKQLYEALKKQGENTDYIILKGADHADLYWYQKPVMEIVVNWFKEQL